MHIYKRKTNFLLEVLLHFPWKPEAQAEFGL